MSLARHGRGVAMIDEFSVAEGYMPGLVRVPLAEPSAITARVTTKKGRQPSGFAEFAIARFHRELARATQTRPWEAAGPKHEVNTARAYIFDVRPRMGELLRVAACEEPGGRSKSGRT